MRIAYFFILFINIVIGGVSKQIQATENSSPFLSENELSEFYRLRISSSDLTLPSGWPRPYTLKIIEQFFKTPLIVPDTTQHYLDQVDNASSLSEIFNLSKAILSNEEKVSVPPVISKNLIVEKIKFPHNVPLKRDLQIIIEQLYMGIWQATPLIKKSSDSVGFENKQNFLSLNEWPNLKTGLIKDELSTRRIKAQYAAMASFDEKSLLEATKIIFKTIDDSLPSLEKISWKHHKFKPLKMKTPLGWVVIRGSGNDVYKPEDLENVVLLIDLGGRNSYEGSVAYAEDGQIRIALDFGQDIQIKTSNIHNAGVGIFGIGIFITPNNSDKKVIETGTHSLGCGLGGTGVFINKGNGIFKGNVYSQGVASFGIGIFKSELSNNSTFTVNRMGQGLGYVKGLGIFSLKGDKNNISGGLTDPDPREPKGAVSLCQGVGYGHRSYVGGGVGLASINGNQNNISSSYFAQGVGYWKSLGGFRLQGNENKIVARRYDQGSGVHYAFGYFHMKGNKNHLSNWGVGPAHAWDHSFASSLIEGNENVIQTEWGAGSAQIGSISFPIYRGDNNKISQLGLSDAPFSRGEFSYVISTIKGKNNKLKFPHFLDGTNENNYTLSYPWGIVKLSGTTIDPNLELPKQEWPDIRQDEVRAREQTNLSAQIKESIQKPPKEKISDLLEVAAAFSIDKTSPRQALKKLLSLTSEEVINLVEVLDPISVEQMVVLQSVLPSYGSQMVKAIKYNFASSDLEKKAVLINMLGRARPSESMELLKNFVSQKISSEEERRVKLNAIRTLAQLQNKDTGIEPGIKASLLAILNSLESPFSTKKKKILRDLLNRIRLYDQIALFSISLEISPEMRNNMGELFPEDLTTSFGEKGITYLIEQWNKNRSQSIQRIKTELAILSQNETSTREELITVLKSTRTTELVIAIAGLGQVQNAQDFNKITPFLEHHNSLVRETTSLTLGRFGDIAIPFSENAFNSSPAALRRQIMAFIPHATTEKALPLLMKALADPEADIRLSAVSIMRSFPPIFSKKIPHLKKFARQRLKTEKDPSVKRLLELFLL
ncbi:MAG: HEAT repeat domain-containing protein [Elusimicrobiota bacterium]